MIVKIEGNHLPKETWNKLDVNIAGIDSLPTFSCRDIDMLEVDGWKQSRFTPKYHKDLSPRDTEKIRALSKKGEIISGVGPDLDRLIVASKIDAYRFEAKGKNPKPLILNFDFLSGAADLTPIEIVVGDGVEAVVVEQLTAKKVVHGVAGAQIKFKIGKNAKVTFVQVQDILSNMTFINDVGAIQKDDSEFNVITSIISGGTTYYGCQTNLYGKRAKYNHDIGYMVKGNEKLDMNFVAEHIAKKTEASIHAEGVLRGNAYKIFRSTVDFNAGCTASSGEERENVLLMDDTVINKTVPLILCDEEDVEGAHGGTIGRLDDETLFYMMSRGMTKEEVYQKVANARLDAVINRIPVPEIRDRWINRLHPEEEE
ncbi:MAG: SufD family Fe-S cluster assembly protein [Lachnospiraceae bacterium]|nr:SufD family Fe-S cluster assembly protein [Lachnospiraceae bacterium]